MWFLNPLFLAAAGAIAAPILIHLLNRQRYKKVEWAAMRFVLEAIKRTHRRLRLEEILLLCLRCLIILLLALALARPFFSGSFLGIAKEGDRYVILAIDASYSMGARAGHETAFDRAKKQAAGIVADLRRGDKLSVVVLSHAPHALQADPTSNHELARTEVMSLAPSHGGANLASSLELLHEMIRKSKLKNAELYILTDNQRRFWNGLKEEPDADLRISLNKLSRSARTFVIDAGLDAGANVTVGDLRTSAPVVAKGFPFKFLADVVNYGGDPATDVEVTLFVGEQRHATRSVSLAPGETKTVAFDYRFDRTGPIPARIELSADSLDLDNHRYLALQVEEGVKVLVVDPKILAPPLKSESFFLRFALNPQFEEGRNDKSPIVLAAASPRDLDAMDLNEYRVIFLTNVGDDLPAAAVERLNDYARNGGGLIQFLGDRASASAFNSRYFGDRGFLAAPLAGPGGDASLRRFVNILESDTDHPVLRELKDHDRSLKHLLVYQYLACDEARMPEDALVLARYAGGQGLADSGAPAVVERRLGKGRSILITTSVGDPKWSEMFADYTGTFHMFLHELTRYASRGGSETLQLHVGETIAKLLPSELFQKEVLLRPPGREPIPQTVSKNDAGEFRVSFDDTESSGLYLLQRATSAEPRPEDAVAWFAVNIDPREGDLLREPAGEMSQFLKAQGVTWMSMAEGGAPIQQRAAGAEYWKELLFLLLILMGVEMFCAWRFGSFRKKGA
jgi:hypothetical protein